MLGGALDLDPALRLAPRERHLDLARTREVLPGERLIDLADFFGRALGDDLATVDACAGADVDDLIGRDHRAFVVFNDDDGIAKVAQSLERGDQSLVVALVQADRWLIKDVKHADEARTDLRGEPNALRLPARERGSRAVHRQIANADIHEEVQALFDLFQDQLCHLTLSVAQLDLADPLERGGCGKVRVLMQAQPVDPNRTTLGSKARAVAIGTWLERHDLFEELTSIVGVGLRIAAFDRRNDALVLGHVGALVVAPRGVRDRDALFAEPIQEDVAGFVGEFVPRHGRVKACVIADGLGESIEVQRKRHEPPANRAIGDRFGLVLDHEVWIDRADHAKAMASRAGTVGRVEGEAARLELGHRGAAIHAEELLAVQE